MGKILTTEETEKLALELARNQHFMERLDDYDKQAINALTENEIWLYEREVSIGLRIPQERIDKIASFRLANKRLKMDVMLKNLNSIIEDKTNTTDSINLSHKQQALILIYNGEDLHGDVPLRLKNEYAALNKPGSAGERERRCAGGVKKTLSQRLTDFKTIVPFIHSEAGLQKLIADKTAVEKEYDNM